MFKRIQKYTIFQKQQWRILLPIFVLALSRFFFLLFLEKEINLSYLFKFVVYPLFFDGFLYLTLLVFLSFLINVKWSIITLSIYFFFSSLIYYHHFQLYQTPPGTGAFAALFETTPQEAFEFTKLIDLSSLLITFLLSTFPLISLIYIKNYQIKRVRIINSASLLLILSLIIHIPYISAPKDSLMPMDYSHTLRDVKNIYHYIEEYYTLIQLREKRNNLNVIAEQDNKINRINQVHVLVIGESLARNHMSVYGYHRKTTPRLDSSKSLLLYNNVISPTTQTRSSIVRMLTSAYGTNTKNFYNEASIISVMRAAGFSTYWISNQGRYGISDTETSALADDANTSIFVNTDWNAKSLDQKVIEPLKSILNKERNKLFLVIHLLGSHFEYAKRVPDLDDFLIKDNTSSSSLNTAQLKRVKEYDATVKYADVIIDSLIKVVNQSNYDLKSLLYLSDHGEDVYDNKQMLLGHGSPIVTKYTVEIPFILWRNEQFIMSNSISPQKNHLNRFFNSCDLFYALADLYDINFSDFDSTKSIFNKNYYGGYPYIINSNGKKIKYDNLLLNEAH